MKRIKLKHMLENPFLNYADEIQLVIQNLYKAKEAMEMGAFHHDACPWLNGKKCVCANQKVKKLLKSLNKQFNFKDMNDN